MVAKTTKTSATGPPVIQIFRPLRTQQSPSRVARVVMLKMSEPAAGSLAALAPKRLPSQRPGSQRRRWSSVPNLRIGIVTVQSEAFSAKTSPVSGQP